MHSIHKMRFFHFGRFVLLWSVHQWDGVSDPPEFFIMCDKERHKISSKVFSFLLKGQKLNHSMDSIQRRVLTRQNSSTRTIHSTWQSRHWDVSKD